MEKKAVLAAGLALFAGATASLASASEAIIAHATVLQHGDAVAGPLALSQPMHIVVALKLRNQPQLHTFIASLHQPHAPMPMTSAQFMAAHSPTMAQAQAVANFMKRSGFANVEIAPNRLLVSGDAPAARVQAAFGTSFVSVRTHDGRIAYANIRDAQVPTALQESVLSVVGLQTVHRARTFANSCTKDGGCFFTGHTPNEFASIYGAKDLSAATDVSVGIITSGDMTQTIADLGGKAPTTVVCVDNGGVAGATSTTDPSCSNSGDQSGGEWQLDSQTVVGMSGGLQGIVFYSTHNLQNSYLTDDYNKAVVDDSVKILNVSLGECETYAKEDGSAAAQDQIFEQAVAQGQTFSVSSGDSGADECTKDGLSDPIPQWPAASQYVLAVGGTRLNTTLDDSTIWNGESAWSGSGGSPSTFEPMPSWQQGLGQNAGHNTRGVPDIAFDADPDSGAIVVINGQQVQIGGTSLSAPLFAGAWARIIAAKGSRIGFADPLIYQAPTSSFHDITSGSNGAETAAAGYDLVTGRGSPILNQLFNSLAISPIFMYGDINGDEKADLFWYSQNLHEMTYWLMDGANQISWKGLSVPAGYWPVGIGDFNGDKHADILWTDASHDLYMWVNDGAGGFTSHLVVTYRTYRVAGVGDMDGDGKSDIIWFDQNTGGVTYWLMNGWTQKSWRGFSISPAYHLAGVGDFDGDGRADLLWADNATRQVYAWIDDGQGGFTSHLVNTYQPGWEVAGVGDVDGNGKADIFWYNQGAGNFTYWLMDGATKISWREFSIDSSYRPITIADFSGNRKADMLWTNSARNLLMSTDDGTGGFDPHLVVRYSTNFEPFGG